jgi:diguanylate cyclase (GGDEF)-like protein/PAS domain S-box-containing protein
MEARPAEARTAFERAETPLDAAARDAVLDAVLSQNPDAHLVAIGANELFVPMPASVPLTSQSVITTASSILDLVIAEDRLKVIHAWEHAQAMGASSEVVHTLADPDRPVQLYFLDATHRHGVFLGFMVGLGGDEQMPDVDQVVLPPRVAVVHKNGHAVITKTDQATTQILGWSAEELLGRRTTEFIHPEDHERAIAAWMDLLGRPGGTRRVRLRHRRKDGGWLWMEVTNHNRLRDPERGDVLTEMVDISDEMAALEALRASEQLLRRLTEALPEGVLQLDTRRQGVYCNQQFAAMVGDTATPSAERLLQLVVPADRALFEKAVTWVLQEGRDSDLEMGYQHPAGGTRRYSVRLRALAAEDGAVSGAILCLADVTEDARLRQELTHRATYDLLTRCLNRASIIGMLEELLSRARREREGAAVVFADLDKFKQVNDRFGHAAGDRLLVHVADRLLGAVRDGDLVGRLGGDEFLVICCQVPSPDEALAIGERVAAAVRGGSLTIKRRRITPRLSVGVAWTPAGGCTADTLIARADVAMYQSKRYRDGAPTLADA